jgi:cobalt-zinc-cadmium efflux system protein
MRLEAVNGHTSPYGARRTLVLAVVLTLGYACIEAAVGWWAGSLVLLSDAGHMVSDSAALGLAALAAWAARRPPSPRHSYGLGRAEIVAAFVNAVVMLAMLMWIAVAAVQRLIEPQTVRGEAVAAVAMVGLLLNAAVALVLARGERNMNTRGALLHVLGDLLGSIAAVMAGAVIAATGWLPIDALLSLFICALMLLSGLRLLRDALHALMEGVPFGLSLTQVAQAMVAVPGVVAVHDLHIWHLSSATLSLSAHVVVADMRGWNDTLRVLVALLRDRFQVAHVTLQPEAPSGPLCPMAQAMRPGESTQGS